MTSSWHTGRESIRKDAAQASTVLYCTALSALYDSTVEATRKAKVDLFSDVLKVKPIYLQAS